jgi:hypothetical protein
MSTIPCLAIMAVHGSSHSWIVELLGAGAGIYFFVRGFLVLQRKQLIRNTPASKVRSASLGLVEVSGLAAGPYTTTAPITETACYCYRTLAWQLKQSGKNKEWKKVAEETRHVPFFLDDNTGKVLVDPRGAELDIHRDFHEEYSDSVFSSHDLAPPQVSDFLARHGVPTDGQTVRIDEYCVKPKNFLFILGTLAENPGITVGPTPISTNGNESLSFEQTVADHLSSLSFSWGSASDVVSPVFAHTASNTTTVAGKEPVPASDPGSSASSNVTQQSRIAAALMRAGITNPAAWNAAGIDPATHVRPLDSPFGNMNPESPGPEPWDLHPPVVLMKGKNNPAFLISWRSQSAVLATLSWKSTLMIWGGPALTLVCLYLIAAQFGML